MSREIILLIVGIKGVLESCGGRMSCFLAKKIYFLIMSLVLHQVAAGSLFSFLSEFNKSNSRTFKDHLHNFFEVDSGAFYRSQQLTPTVLKSYIEKFGIKTLVNLRGVNETVWYQREEDVSRELGINFYSISMSAVVLSSREDLLKLLAIYDFAPRPILVHCLGGADRTGEASALWVLEIQKKSKEEALKQLSITYGHRKLVNSAKDFLIHMWQGRSWLEREYDPAHYPFLYRAKEGQ